MADLKPYRRGLTLGLTIAEIFILLLFLLLLALYAVETDKNEASKNGQEETTGTEVPSEPETLRGTPPPDEITTVASGYGLQDTPEPEPQTPTIFAKPTNGESKTPSGTPPTDITTVGSGNGSQDTPGPRPQTNTTGPEPSAKCKKECDKYPGTTTQLQAGRYSRKGIDPPCWYTLETRNGERYEKPNYLLDIAVYDERLNIRLRNPPPGSAIDESGQTAPVTYAEEYAKLPLAPLQTASSITLLELDKTARPIKEMGKNGQIRDYSCVFYVKVWDLTSETAKKRWQQAEDSIKNWFYTYRVRNDPWESTDAAN